ncbi:hypothetical protein BD414DRAFT_48158 [Trametes punicea]|nr:hypothetical protein BD414DRAFT_48158 [Trametes punicea]
MVHPTGLRSSSPTSPAKHGLDEARPSKRRRISPVPISSHNPTLQQLLLEELDLEIAIRQRIAETVQSRITWALLLQQSLHKSSSFPSEDFRSASLDALDAIEAPCDLIFNREVRLAPQPIRPAPNAAPANAPPTDLTVLSGPASRSTRTRGLPRAAPVPRQRLLFIRNTATDPPEIAKLACPVCSRSDFSSLQGLLNHCRLRHQLEYGSHDECMQSCAVLVSEEERDWVVASGIEVGGVSLPSLRRLFEIAVGAGDKVILPSRKPSPVTPAPVETNREQGPPIEKLKEETLQEIAQPTAHITKTLGYHIDTPALAPFLGRAPKKRCIHVRANEDDLVNIEDTSEGSGPQGKRVWRKPYAHRNIARKELDEVVFLSELPEKLSTEPADEDQEKDGPPEAPPRGDKSALRMLSGTRFHITARVQVADYSLFLPPNRRPAQYPDHTHRWRLSITSPSYSLPISSILRKLTVACVTDPPPSTLTDPVTISDPPFAVTSTTDKPFLARLTFFWAGTTNPPTDMEHWVELDPMHYSKPVMGDEQVFDVELDRSTELLPARAGVKDIPLEDMHNTETTAPAANEGGAEAGEAEAEPDYAMKLRSLLPHFPMTLKDIKGRFSSRLPYTLVNNPTQLRNMHYGRRKAIEMGRARALRDAYSQLVSQQQETDVVPLTTADVYHWLEDEGFFPRSDLTGGKQESQKQVMSSRKLRGPGALAPYAFCRTCGLHRAYHPKVTDEDTKPVDIKPGALSAALERGLCMSFNGEGGEPTRRPIFDVDTLLKFAPSEAAEPVPYELNRAIFVAPPATSEPSQGQAPSSSPTELVSVADPKLTVAIQRISGLPHLRKAPDYGQAHVAATAFSLTSLPRSEAAAYLAPAALLAAALKALVRQLVGRGVDTLRRDEAALRVATGRHERARRAGSGDPALPRRVLAPAHILRGVAAHASTGLTGSALRVCLARLGERSAVLPEGAAAGAVHIHAGQATTRDEKEGRQKEHGRGEKDGALMPGPRTVVPNGVVVKAEEV